MLSGFMGWWVDDERSGPVLQWWALCYCVLLLCPGWMFCVSTAFCIFLHRNGIGRVRFPLLLYEFLYAMWKSVGPGRAFLWFVRCACAAAGIAAPGAEGACYSSAGAELEW